MKELGPLFPRKLKLLLTPGLTVQLGGHEPVVRVSGTGEKRPGIEGPDGRPLKAEMLRANR